MFTDGNSTTGTIAEDTAVGVLPSFGQDSLKWDLPEGAIARLGKGTINKITYSPDESQLAVAGSIGIWVYDADTGAEVALLTGHTGAVSSIAYNPDGTTLASGSADGTVRLWDTTTGALKNTLTGHRPGDRGAVTSVVYSPDGTTLATGGYRDARLWDPTTGTPDKHTHRTHRLGP